MLRSVVLVSLLGLLLSCGGNVEIENFDVDAWQSDRLGCKNIRLEMLPRLREVRNQLEGLNEDQIQQLLGDPDRAELYTRGQRFYYYDITPAEACETDSTDRDIDLFVRFNALGIVSEANLQQFTRSVNKPE